MRIAVSGPPGSGKTTLAKKLANSLEYRYVCGGEIFRREAQKLNMTLEEFSKYVEEHPEVDIKLDNYLAEEAKNLRVVVDSRLSGWLMKKHGIKGFKIYVDASPEERARRIQKRDGGRIEDIMRKMLEREESEVKRYQMLYGADYRNRAIYDLVLYTDYMSEEEVFSKALEEYEKWLKIFW